MGYSLTVPYVSTLSLLLSSLDQIYLLLSKFTRNISVSFNSSESRNIPICVSTLWSSISTPGVYQDNETSSGYIETDGIHLIIYLDNILIMHQEKEHLMQLTTLMCQKIRSPIVNMANHSWFQFRILVNSVSLHLVFPTKKNPAGCSLPPEKAGGVSQVRTYIL